MFVSRVFKKNNSGGEYEFEGLKQLSVAETSVSLADARYLEGIIVYYEDFADINKDNLNLKSETARALRRIGNIYHMVGKLTEAVSAYERSMDMFQEIVDDNSDVELILAQTRTRNEMAIALSAMGTGQVARQLLSESIKALTTSPYKDQVPVKVELVETLLQMPTSGSNSRIDFLEYTLGGANHRKRKPLDRPGRGFGPPIDESSISKDRLLIFEAVQVLESLESEISGEVEFNFLKARCYRRLAEIQFVSKDQTKAQESIELTIQLLNELVKLDPDNFEFKFALAQAYSTPVNLKNTTNYRNLQTAQSIAEDLGEQQPNNLRFKYLEGQLNIQLARIHSRDDDKLPQAIERLEAAMEIAKEVRQKSPRTTNLDMRYAETKLFLTNLLLRSDRPQDALNVIQQNISEIESFRTDRRRFPVIARMLSRSYTALGAAYRELGETGKAESADDKARELSQNFNPPNRGGRKKSKK